MKSPESYDYLVFNGLAELFNVQLSNFTFYASLPNLPTDETVLAKLLDVIPIGGEFLDDSISVNYFSKIYGLILEAQKEKPLSIEIGLNNYNNVANWIIPYTVPKYSPNLDTIKEAIDNSQKSKLVAQSNRQPISIPVYPQFPELVVNNSMLEFNNQVAQSTVTTTITFSQSTNQRISFGNWFSSAAFLYAYQTPSNWDDSIISWEDVFNDNTGILKYINTHIIAVSDMKIEIQISGNYNEENITILQSIPEQVIFPFYQKINASSINYSLESDKSLKIELIVPKNQDYIFGMQYERIKNFLT
ncbi:hypothetical protein [Tenacibaculum sp.]|uniref:hypothetical protein n=1 Tax=Tenacibaculum sp. TaxID=1906242 RepID=UPI003D12C61C